MISSHDLCSDSLFKGDAGELEESESSAQISNWNDVMAIDFNNHVRDSTNDVSSSDFPSQQVSTMLTHLELL